MPQEAPEERCSGRVQPGANAGGRPGRVGEGGDLGTLEEQTGGGVMGPQDGSKRRGE